MYFIGLVQKIVEDGKTKFSLKHHYGISIRIIMCELNKEHKMSVYLKSVQSLDDKTKKKKLSKID